jgi:hypothetical protein
MGTRRCNTRRVSPSGPAITTRQLTPSATSTPSHRKVLDSDRYIDAALDVVRLAIQPMVRLSYSTRVSIDAGNFPAV